MWQRDYAGGYISGLLDATILRLNTPGRRVICIDPDADKDKVVDRIFSYVEEPKDKKRSVRVHCTGNSSRLHM
jgi:hypothetical protein